MSSFTIRVELHQATREHYALLAKNLAAIGVVDVITADNGIKYKLPPAEYIYVGNVNIETVREAVQNVARGVGRPFAVFVTEAVRWSWAGLEKIA